MAQYNPCSGEDFIEISGPTSKCTFGNNFATYSLINVSAAQAPFITWSFFDLSTPFPSGTPVPSNQFTIAGSNLSATGKWPSNYGMIIVSYDDGSCMDSDTLYIQDCCTVDPVPGLISDVTYNTATTISFLNQQVRFAGTILITNNTVLYFFNCTIYMEIGARFIVDRGSQIVLDNSQVGQACDYMWEGIILRRWMLGDPNGPVVKLIGAAPAIRHAQHAINTGKYGEVKIESGIIQDNFIGILTPATPSGNIAIFAPFENFSINCDHGLIYPKYNGQLPTPGPECYAGMEINQNSLVTDPNNTGLNISITNLNIGMILRNCSAIIRECDFNNIQPISFYTASANYNGSGIYSIGNHGFPSLHQQGNGANGPPSFNNCKFGINNITCDLSVINNNMTNMTFGIYARDCNAPYNIRISGNTISASLYGTDIRRNPGNTTLIQSNTINLLQPASSNNGIYIDEYSIANSITIDNNVINSSFISNGINMVHTENSIVSNNIVNWNNTSFNRVAIGVNDCNRVQVIRNEIYGTGATFASSRGIFVQNCQNGEYICNHVRSLFNDIIFRGMCPGTNLLTNTMENGDKGLKLETFPLIGTQTDRGNRFLGTFVGGVGAQCQLGYESGCQIFTPGTPIYTPNPVPNANWFFLSPNAPPECRSPQEQLSINNFSNNNFPIFEFDSLIALGNLSFFEFNSEINWTLNRYLHYKILTNDSTINQNSLIGNFFNAIENENIGIINNVIEDFNDNFQGLNQHFLLIRSLDSLRNLVFHQIIFNQQSGNISMNNSLVNQINAISLSINQYFEIIDSSQQFAFVNALNTINQLVPSNSQEFNIKSILSILFNKFITSNFEFSASEKAVIEPIALQCLITGGDAVLLARTFYQSYENNITFDDESLCYTQSLQKLGLGTHTTTNDDFLVNIKQDQTTVTVQFIENKNEIDVSVIDVSGRIIFRETNKNEIVINKNTISPGVYLIRFNSGLLNRNSPVIIW